VEWVRNYLQAAGHEVYTPSLTGLGERAHLLSPEVTLDTHILDVANLIRYEELTSVILVGWSYGGMVVAAVADRCPGSLAHVIYGTRLSPTTENRQLTWRERNGGRVSSI